MHFPDKRSGAASAAVEFIGVYSLPMDPDNLLQLFALLFSVSYDGKLRHGSFGWGDVRLTPVHQFTPDIIGV